MNITTTLRFSFAYIYTIIMTDSVDNIWLFKSPFSVYLCWLLPLVQDLPLIIPSFFYFIKTKDSDIFTVSYDGNSDATTNLNVFLVQNIYVSL